MIQLHKDWKVKPDGSGWALVKTVKGTSKQGEPITRDKTIGYFGTLHRAVRRFTDEMAKEPLILIIRLRYCVSALWILKWR